MTIRSTSRIFAFVSGSARPEKNHLLRVDFGDDGLHHFLNYFVHERHTGLFLFDDRACSGIAAIGMCDKRFTRNLSHLPFAAPQQADFVGRQHPGSGRVAEPPIEQGGRRSEEAVPSAAFQDPLRVFGRVHFVYVQFG